MSTTLENEDDPLTTDLKSKKSFKYFIYTLLVFFALVLLRPIYRGLSDRSYNSIYEILYVTFLALIIIFSVLGFKNAIQSLIARERWSVFKIAGLIGNFIIFSIVITFLIAGALDVIQFYF